MQSPLFAFFGTSRFAVQVLTALETHGLFPALVVCAPDKPAGRGQQLTPAPTKVWAQERDIDVMTPEKLDAAFIESISNSEWQVFCTAAYGKLLPEQLLSLPAHGALNVHPSLLPKFRGPSPVLSAILADERETGVSIIEMDAQMDHGPIVAQGRVELESDAWPPRGSLFEDLLATEGGNLLAEVLPLWVRGEITPVAQDDAQATYTKKFTDADARISLHDDPQAMLLRIRAFDRNPRAYCIAQTKEGKQIRVIITDAELVDSRLVIKQVIPEGKREMPYETFLASGATVVS